MRDRSISYQSATRSGAALPGSPIGEDQSQPQELDGEASDDVDLPHPLPTMAATRFQPLLAEEHPGGTPNLTWTSAHPKATRAMERPGLCGLGTCVLRVKRDYDPSEIYDDSTVSWECTRLGILCNLGLCVLAALPWVWPVSVTPTPAGGNTTDAGSCLDPDSDNYLDCCDEFGVALKPYWVLFVSAFIFALLLGTTKSTPDLMKQIEAELPQRRAATAAENEAMAAHCCRDDVAEPPRDSPAAAARPTAEIEAALTPALQKRDRWVWLILGIQLIHAIVSTALLVVELRARGLQGWELYQAATLLSFNSSLGGFLAAVPAVSLRMFMSQGVEEQLQVPAGVYKVVLKKNKRVDLGMKIDVTSPDEDPPARQFRTMRLIKRAINLALKNKKLKVVDGTIEVNGTPAPWPHSAIEDSAADTLKDASRRVLYCPLVLYVKPGPDNAIEAIVDDDDSATDPFTARIERAMQRWMWKKVATTSETGPASQNERGCELLECAESDTEPHDAVIWFGDERAIEIRDMEDDRDQEPFLVVTVYAAVVAGGLGAGASVTHVLPGVVLFAPYIFAGCGAVMLMLGAAQAAAATGTATGGQPAPDLLRNVAPQGSCLWSAGEALHQTTCVLVFTAMLVTAATVSCQFYAGVRWDQAIVNDWESRTSAKFVGCVARQLSGTASNSQSNAVAIADFIGLVF